MPEILGWQDVPRRGEIVDKAAQALMKGELVGFPTETIYGIAAAAWNPEAVDRLATCKGRQDSKPMALAVRGLEEIPIWVPNLGKLGWRLARRCLPGPVTLVYDVEPAVGLARGLPESVRPWVCPTGTLGMRVPDHEAILQVLHGLPGPLVLTSANSSGGVVTTHADEVARTFGDRLTLIIDDGPSPLGRASTVVQIKGEHWKVIREGTLSSADLTVLAASMILFVCTGNTCRSPLAEAFCKKLLADQLGCSVEELPRQGYLVRSAGLAAFPGVRAAPEAIDIAREFGVDIQGHISQPVTFELIFQADYLISMTQGHVESLLSRFPDMGPIPHLFCANGADVPDPIGCEKPVYRDCADLLRKGLEPWVKKFLEG